MALSIVTIEPSLPQNISYPGEHILLLLSCYEISAWSRPIVYDIALIWIYSCTPTKPKKLSSFWWTTWAVPRVTVLQTKAKLAFLWFFFVLNYFKSWKSCGELLIGLFQRSACVTRWHSGPFMGPLATSASGSQALAAWCPCLRQLCFFPSNSINSCWTSFDFWLTFNDLLLTFNDFWLTPYDLWLTSDDFWLTFNDCWLTSKSFPVDF